MDVLREHLDVLDRRHRQNAMAKVEDVPMPVGDTRQDVFGLAEHALRWTEQECRVEVALHTALESDSLPRGVDRDSPIDPNHVTTSVGNLRKDCGGARAEMDRRHLVSDRVENPTR